MPRLIELQTPGIEGLALIAKIDRSEHVEAEYTVVAGRLVERPVSMPDIPPWDPEGSDEWSVGGQMAFCRPIVERGGVLVVALDGDEVLGLAVVEGAFEPGLAWLAYLHVSRPHRRRGVAAALWGAARDTAIAAGAETMYVSAVPTASAVRFYLSRGCVPADPVHSDLYQREPDDVHLVCRLAGH